MHLKLLGPRSLAPLCRELTLIKFQNSTKKPLSKCAVYYCWWKKSCTTWDVYNLANGTNYQPQLVNAGFLNHQQYQSLVYYNKSQGMWPAISCCLITHVDRSVLYLVSLQNSLPWQWKRQHRCINGCPFNIRALNHGFGDENVANQDVIWEYAGYVIYKHIMHVYILLQSRPISTRRNFTISENCITNEDPNVNPYFSLAFLEGMKGTVHVKKNKTMWPNNNYRITCVAYTSYSDQNASFEWKWRSFSLVHQHKQQNSQPNQDLACLGLRGETWKLLKKYHGQGSSHSCRSNLPVMQLQVKDTLRYTTNKPHYKINLQPVIIVFIILILIDTCCHEVMVFPALPKIKCYKTLGIYELYKVDHARISHQGHLMGPTIRLPFVVGHNYKHSQKMTTPINVQKHPRTNNPNWMDEFQTLTSWLKCLKGNWYHVPCQQTQTTTNYIICQNHIQLWHLTSLF